MKVKDQIYQQPLTEVAGFSFDAAVAQVFPDMIQRSVPGYLTLVENIGVIGAQFYQTGSRCYDLGCSLGAVSFSLRRQNPQVPIVAVDNSEAMLARCDEHLRRAGEGENIELRCADITQLKIENASVVVLNFTLQFVELAQREALLAEIYAGLNRGGVLILSEKIALESAEKEQRFVDLHHGFKRANGYSDLEISQKRSALENVLIPETVQQHQQRLQAVGFESVEVWFQCWNFVSLLAVK
ncbi:MAG: carboxy-S-adenosyl-L-methionine synthase CmoA [Gammaproteobacteria bacterium]|nr:carboxy-S-adenosyl-L-methionine synthase CmoA [Gammaproteobacteria bacterium]